MPAVRSVRGDKTPRTLKKHMKELEKTGKTVVPCPHGHGWYQISLEGSHWYATPEIIFSASEKCPQPYADPYFGGAAFRVSEGRIIAWYPKWMGLKKNVRSVNRMMQREHMLRLAKMVVMIIMAGNKLYTMRCGDMASSEGIIKNSHY